MRLKNRNLSGSTAFTAALALLTVGLVLPACSAEGGPAAASAEMAEGGNEVVAEVAGKPVTMSELEELASPQLKQLERQKHEILERTLTQLVEAKLFEAEANARGMSPDALVEAEVQSPEITDEAAAAWYEENKARINRPKDDQLMEQIKSFLANQGRAESRNAVLSNLREKYAVRVLLEPQRADVSAGDAPSKGGGADAPVTIVEFSDFECPFCSRVNPAIKQVMETYGDKVRVAFRQFPLEIHPNARKAAEASLCAHDQGKFWEMHDAMFADQRNLGVPALKEKATGLELDMAKFNECLDSGKYADQVEEDFRDGQAAGVSGTPAMFVNGRLVSGAVPFEQIAQVIDDELSRKGVK